MSEQQVNEATVNEAPRQPTAEAEVEPWKLKQP